MLWQEFLRAQRTIIEKMAEQMMHDQNLPLEWFDVLIHVGGAPEGQLTMSKLSADIALTTGGVTRLVDRMVDAHLVARQSCPSDRRTTPCQRALTAPPRNVYTCTRQGVSSMLLPMQRTASKPAFYLMSVCHPHFHCESRFSGLAVADLGSR